MKIEIHRRKRFERYEQFDPLTSPDVTMYHMECGGGLTGIHEDRGLIGIHDERACFVVCKACGDKVRVNGVSLRAAMRSVLIEDKPKEVGEKLALALPEGSVS